MSATNSEFPEERQIHDEIRELRREQAEISLKDNFAQHAKKERKILKLKEDLKKYGEDWHRWSALKRQISVRPSESTVCGSRWWYGKNPNKTKIRFCSWF